jgi:hypothetical protein
MQAGDYLIKTLRDLSAGEAKVFASADLAALLPGHQTSAFKSLLSRLETRGELRRICRGIYILPEKMKDFHGLLLARVAVRLRAERFTYLSLESVLSEAGLISQIPINRMTLMTSGRSGVIDCGNAGSLEFVHTRKTPASVQSHLSYDPLYRLFRADSALALRDYRDAGRDQELLTAEALDEPV